MSPHLTVAKSYNGIYNTFTVPCEKSKTVSFASSIMKNVVFPGQSRFPVKLICCIAFGSTSSSYCLLKGCIRYIFAGLSFKSK